MKGVGLMMMYVCRLGLADDSITVLLLLCPIWARKGIWISRYAILINRSVIDH
jgi:hypothetical protein